MNKENLGMTVKKLFQNKIIELDYKNSSFIIDINKLIEFDLEIEEIMSKNILDFIEIVKEEGELYINNGNVRIINWKEERDISKIRVDDIGKTFKIDGMVNKITDTMALVKSKSYECLSCGETISVSGSAQPSRCSCGNRSNFKLINTELENIREMVLEELQEKTRGKQPQKLRIRLSGELTKEKYSEIITPGKKISVIGNIDKIKLNNKFNEEIYEFKLFAISIQDLEEKFDDTISDEDMNKIIEISQNKPLEILSNSLSPEIIGLNELKKLIVLQMVGGVKNNINGKIQRNWINLLVVGDPGMAKSYLANCALLRTPKSFYSSGDNATAVGLTGGVVKDELLGNYAIEAGVLVKANGSTAIIDELDKFEKSQLNSLHTPMESGFVKISKIVNATLPAETAVLALANPKKGMFDESKQLVQQINLPPSLLNRFDIVLLIKDEINKDADSKIVDSVFLDKIKDKKNMKISLFRKYITYAKEFKPKFNSEISDIKNFYNDIRMKSKSTDSNMKGMPINTRHLYTIKKLAEASAKIRLSNIVEKEDIELAKSLFYESLIKIGIDDSGIIDLSRIGVGTPLSKRKLIELVLDKMRILYSENKGGIDDLELKKIMTEAGMKETDYYQTMEELNRYGEIIKQDNKWKLV